MLGAQKTVSHALGFQCRMVQRDSTVLTSTRPISDELRGQPTSRDRDRASFLRCCIDAATWLYTFGGYALAIYLVTRPGWGLPLVGVLLMTHTMILSALLTHECMHGTMGRSPALNAFLGRATTLISGACYVPYTLLRRQHLNHHGNRVGYDGFSVARWVGSLPPPLRAVIIALEWCYFPVLSYIARVRSLVVPFLEERHRRLRKRIALVFLLRAGFYLVLFYISPWSWVGLFASHLAMLTILRIYDCFHHTFDITSLGTSVQRLDGDHEQRNTYSSLISSKHAWLNAIFLNYGYHNAHHAYPRAHWTELSKIDLELYPTSRVHCLHFGDLLHGYHRYRTTRIVKGLGRPKVVDGRLALDGYFGIIMNISFIVYDV